jgi:hypothetical protein
VEQKDRLMWVTLSGSNIKVIEHALCIGLNGYHLLFLLGKCEG